MYKIAVIGDRDSIYGFAAVGLEIRPVSSVIEAVHTLRSLAEEDYAVIYITEQYYAQLGHDIARYAETPLPAIIPLPGVTGNNGIGIEGVKQSVVKAVGSDIVFGGN